MTDELKRWLIATSVGLILVSSTTFGRAEGEYGAHARERPALRRLCFRGNDLAERRAATFFSPNRSSPSRRGAIGAETGYASGQIPVR